jgi:hypothetical protein
MIHEEGRMNVNTKKVTGRRELRFNSLSEIEDDARRLTVVPVKHLGNWSLGQVLHHLAIVMHQSIDGMPLQVAWYLRLLGPLFKKRFLTKGLTPGFQISRGALRSMVADPSAGSDEGLIALREAIARLETETPARATPRLRRAFAG